jgi:Signal transduction histidine kinase
VLNRLRRELESSDNDPVSNIWIDLFDERVQPLLAAVLVTLSLLTVRPIGGHTVLTYGLVALCGAFAFVRLLSDRWLSLWPRFAVSVAFGVTAGLAFGASGWCVSLAFVACSHFGARWPTRVAICLTLMTVAIAMISNPAAGSAAWNWYAVILVGLTILPGLASQSRRRTLQLSRQLVEQTQRTAESDARASAMAERTRIARDIHDVLAHTLSGVSLQLDLADAQLELGRQEEGRGTVQTARGLVVDGLDEARRAVRALRDGTLDLRSTFERMVQPGEQLEVAGDVDALEAVTGQETVRIVQEALTNVRRHAQGASTRVRVVCAGELVDVDVVNGPGEAVGTGTGSGMGLVGIRERVELLGGSCTIGPVNDGEFAGGWRVSAQLPIRRNAEESNAQ